MQRRNLFFHIEVTETPAALKRAAGIGCVPGFLRTSGSEEQECLR